MNTTSIFRILLGYGLVPHVGWPSSNGCTSREAPPSLSRPSFLLSMLWLLLILPGGSFAAEEYQNSLHVRTASAAKVTVRPHPKGEAAEYELKKGGEMSKPEDGLTYEYIEYDLKPGKYAVSVKKR